MAQTEQFVDFFDFKDQYEAANTSTRPQLLDDYIDWQTERGFPAIQNDTTVVFIYYNESENVDSIRVAGDFNVWSDTSWHMTQLDENVPFYYHVMEFEPTARFDYAFSLNYTWILDPRNPNILMIGENIWSSELAMPQFVQPSEIEYRDDIDHGTLSETQSLPNVLNSQFFVYLPPNYDPSISYPTVYTSDGEMYWRYCSSVNVLDNLIADGVLQPMIVVFTNPVEERVSWYCCNPNFLAFMDDLVSYIDANYPTIRDPYSRAHVGDSMGGLASIYLGYERPDTFKLIGAQSGTFYTGGYYVGHNVFDHVQAAPDSMDLKFWMSVGTYEGLVHDDTHLMENISRAHGWATEAIYLHEGHTLFSWRHTFGDMLEFLLPGENADGYTTHGPNSYSTSTSTSWTEQLTRTSSDSDDGGILSGFTSSIGMLTLFGLCVVVFVRKGQR